MVEFEIREECLAFRSKLTKTSLIASNLPYDDMSANLLDFLSSFDDKLSHFSVGSFPNFLAYEHIFVVSLDMFTRVHGKSRDNSSVVNSADEVSLLVERVQKVILPLSTQ